MNEPSPPQSERNATSTGSKTAATSGRFGPLAVGAALLLALATFVIFAGFTPIIPTPVVVLSFSAATR